MLLSPVHRKDDVGLPNQRIDVIVRSLLFRRLERYQQFKNFEKRILVATDLFGRGMDIEKVNVVFNYDMPASADQYLHRVARAGRFGTKGMAISFVTTDEDAEILNQVQSRLEVQIDELPEDVE